jgi:hypothetical protein
MVGTQTDLFYSWALPIHVYTYSLGTMIKKLNTTNKTITDHTNKYKYNNRFHFHTGYSTNSTKTLLDTVTSNTKIKMLQ